MGQGYGQDQVNPSRSRTAPPSRPFSAAFLSAMAFHVSYELDMAIKGYLRPPGDQLAFDACLLHVRNLIEFFIGRENGRKPDDLWPTDYVPTWEVDADVDAGVADRLRYHLDAIDKHLSHLSLARVPADANGQPTRRQFEEEDLPDALPGLLGEVVTLARRFVAETEAEHPGTVGPIDLAVKRAETDLAC